MLISTDRKEKDMTALELLKEDHQEVINLIGELEAADDETEMEPRDTGNFNRLSEAIKLHSRMEEEIFYPAMEEFEETREQARAAFKEHQMVDHLLAQLATLSPSEDEFQETLAELRDAMERHIEEEEGELFPKAEELCGQSRLDEMERQMVWMKNNSRVRAATTRRR
jgi:hemerythrin-like domain-containing protein